MTTPFHYNLLPFPSQEGAGGYWVLLGTDTVPPEASFAYLRFQREEALDLVLKQLTNFKWGTGNTHSPNACITNKASQVAFTGLRVLSFEACTCSLWTWRVGYARHVTIPAGPPSLRRLIWRQASNSTPALTSAQAVCFLCREKERFQVEIFQMCLPQSPCHQIVLSKNFLINYLCL